MLGIPMPDIMKWLVFLVPVWGFLLDMFLRDPHWLPHPVRLLGYVITRFELTVLRSATGNQLELMGFGVVLLLCGAAHLIVRSLVDIPLLGIIFAIYFSYSGLALFGLLNEGWKVEAALRQGNIEAARYELSMLVSRDTKAMDESEIRRSLAETISENFSDGFVAPFFYLIISGPAGLWVYKTINTLDSMWGYKTEKYIDLGKWPAKIDDWANFIPSRLSAFMLLHAGSFMGMDAKAARAAYKADAEKMESPNAGWPMAVCAWLIGRQMGGTTMYFGKPKEKPVLGPEGRQWTGDDIQLLFKLVHRAGWLTMLWLMLMSLIFTF